MRTKAFLLLLIILPTLVTAQRWKRQRYEWVTGVGATQFLGDVGGRDQIGSDFFFDMDAASTRYVVNLGMRYKISQYVSAKTSFSFGEIAGDDKFTKEPFRQNRNIHFRSPIVEWATQIEASWMKESTGSRYKIRRVRGKGRKGSQVYVYGFAGVGLLYMNPMAQYNGKWHALKPLHTEGQEFVPSRKEYANWQFVIPFGVGMKYSIDKSSSIGLEYGLRKTFTDYMDDVSTSYVYTKWATNSAFLQQTLGYDDVAAALADPSLNRVSGDVESFPGACSACPGQQRGDPSDLDSYMFMMITYQRKIRTTRKGLPKF
ncbi:MAG: outer membrane beta-barrel protein [Flavobacteriales bacterium]|nr:outer membrane beta-barrel protein [Flavobacteriales bacterium]